MPWISVKEKLPPKDKYVKVRDSMEKEFIARYRCSFLDRIFGLGPYWEYLSGLRSSHIYDSHCWEETDDR